MEQVFYYILQEMISSFAKTKSIQHTTHVTNEVAGWLCIHNANTYCNRCARLTDISTRGIHQVWQNIISWNGNIICIHCIFLGVYDGFLLSLDNIHLPFLLQVGHQLPALLLYDLLYNSKAGFMPPFQWSINWLSPWFSVVYSKQIGCKVVCIERLMNVCSVQDSLHMWSCVNRMVNRWTSLKVGPKLQRHPLTQILEMM